jgi:arsenical pump membrane protein
LQQPWTLRDKLDVFFFFLGLMSIAAIAENAKFFDWMAYLAGKQASGSGKKLFLNVFLLGTLISAFLSNDATALILTPVVYTLVIRLRINPLPFMFACTFIADTAAYILPVSNPINILVLGQFPSSLPDFLKRLLVPSAICICINIAFFFWLFRREIPAHFDPTHLENPLPTLKKPRFFRYTTLCLALVVLGYVIASTTGLSLAIVAMAGALLMIGGALVMRQLSLREIGGEVSWSLFGFIAGMFVVIRGVENIGLTGEVGKLMVQLGNGNLFLTIMITHSGYSVGGKPDK